MIRRSPLHDDNVDAFEIEAVCRRSNTGRSFVYEEIRAGRLIAKKFGRLTRVLRADYEAWLAAAPSISPGPASARTTHEPTPALNPGLDPVNVGVDGRGKPARVVERRNGGPRLDPIKAARPRSVRGPFQ